MVLMVSAMLQVNCRTTNTFLDDQPWRNHRPGYLRDVVKSPFETFTGWKEERKKAGRLPASSPVRNTTESMISQNNPFP